MRQGFSLVELSIVLVILGLLTGGILAGQSLIRAAELRSITTDMARYQTAIQTFRDKYFALPGDMVNATKYWGAANTAGAGGECADPANNAGTGTQTCNGNGNGDIIDNEGYRLWQHLANAALMEGSYPGTGASVVTVPTPVIGTNVPRSKISQAGFGVFNFNGSVVNYDQGLYNYPKLLFGYGQFYGQPVIKADEAWNIDTKIDDGKPGIGVAQTFHVYPGGATSTCNTTTVAATAEYALTTSAVNCAMAFKILR